MSKITKFSAHIILCLFHLWNVPSLLVSAKSSDNAIAKVSGARTMKDSVWMNVVPDNTSDSGWAVDVLRNVPANFPDNNYKVFMYATERIRPRFRHYFYQNNLCPLVSKKSRHPKLSFDHFMPTQIMKMILPGRQNSCKFTKGKKAIKSKEKVNADRHDPQNRKLGIPYSFPFDMMVNVVRVGDDNDPVNTFDFQVNFTVDRIGSGSTGQGKGANVINNVTDKDIPLKVPARVISVKNGMKNDFFSAVEDKNSTTGWAVKVAKRIVYWMIGSNVFLDLYAVEPGSNSVSQIFHGYLCDTILYNSKYNGYPLQNYLPRLIASMLFPGYKNNCNFDPGNLPILSNGTADLNPFDNPDVKMPHSPYFNLIANVRSNKYSNESLNVNFFQVNFTIGDSSDTINGVPHKDCLGKNLNNKIIDLACKGYKLIKSGATTGGQKIESTLNLKG